MQGVHRRDPGVEEKLDEGKRQVKLPVGCRLSAVGIAGKRLRANVARLACLPILRKRFAVESIRARF
jgi:hypothetical protein